MTTDPGKLGQPHLLGDDDLQNVEDVVPGDTGLFTRRADGTVHRQGDGETPVNTRQVAAAGGRSKRVARDAVTDQVLGGDNPRWFAEGGHGCWIWLGAVGPDGYGRIWDGTTVQRVHRVAYEVAYGPLQPGALVCHRCDVPLCCNPAHLFAGTHGQNMADMRAKGRSNVGERNGSAKMTAQQVADMRALRAKEGLSYRILAKRFGISTMQAYCIVNGKRWKTA